ncbi:MAG: NUDIX domain-containing protein [Gammaproteobacteria bacterium]|nr:NUDIX domain-containing protein [Gammaproteobacteria bacterium]
MEESLARVKVVTAFLRHRGRILLVQRSSRVGTYQGCWSGISGYLEDATALLQVRREIREETGLSDTEIHLVSASQSIEMIAQELGRIWVVYPFLFDIDDPAQVVLDWENLKGEWVVPSNVSGYPTVPGLLEALSSCLELERL